jgi:hypothetical protein
MPIRIRSRIRVWIGIKWKFGSGLASTTLLFSHYTDLPHLVDLVGTGGWLGEDLTALHSLHHLSHRAYSF